MGPLLADKATLTFPELVVPLLVATVAAMVLWLVLLLAAAFATRPREVDPAPATMEGATASAAIGLQLGYVFRMDLVGPPPAARPEPVEALAPDRQAVAVALLADPGVAVDPAMVVTAEDAGDALGVPVGPAEPLIEPLPVGRMRGCRYAAASGGRASVSVFTAAGETVELLARVHRRFGEAVPGVGDQAWLRGDTIAVVCGEVMVSIRLQGRHVPDSPAATETPA